MKMMYHHPAQDLLSALHPHGGHRSGHLAEDFKPRASSLPGFLQKSIYLFAVAFVRAFLYFLAFNALLPQALIIGLQRSNLIHQQIRQDQRVIQF